MQQQKFEKGEKVIYANSLYEVVYSNFTTTKLRTDKNDKHPICCDTDSVFLKPVKREQQ